VLVPVAALEGDEVAAEEGVAAAETLLEGESLCRAGEEAKDGDGRLVDAEGLQRKSDLRKTRRRRRRRSAGVVDSRMCQWLTRSRWRTRKGWRSACVREGGSQRERGVER